MFKKSINKTGFFLMLIIAFLLIFKAVKSNYKSDKDANPASLIYGKWRIVKYVDGAVSDLTEAQTKAYLDTYILLRPELSAIFGDTCTSPNYKFDTVNTDKYLYVNFRGIDRSSLNITTDKIVIMTTCCRTKSTYNNGDLACDDFIKINNTMMIIGYSGDCYFLSKEK